MRIQHFIFISVAIFISGLFFLNSINLVFAECFGTSALSADLFLAWCALDTPIWGYVDPTLTPKDFVVTISETIIGFGALFAIGAVVFSWIQYTTSYGDDEKIKKAKTTGIYALIGLVLLLTAFPFVDTMINFIYSLS